MPAEERRRRGENVTAPIIGGRERPTMPPGLNDRQKTAWRSIVRDLERAGILDRADAGVIEAAAIAWGRAREARAIVNREGLLATNSQGRVGHPALAIEQAAWKEFRQLADQLPLSPWGRQRLSITIGSGGETDEMERELGPSTRDRITSLKVVGGSDVD